MALAGLNPNPRRAALQARGGVHVYYMYRQ